MWSLYGPLDVHGNKIDQLVYISTLVVASKLSSNAVGEFSGEPRRILWRTTKLIESNEIDWNQLELI